jgi:hypothetical protein
MAATVGVETAVETAGEILGELESLLRGLDDVDLHRADPEGGHTIAEVVSHIQLAGLTSIAAAERMRYRPSGQHMFREEIGHDAVGAPPPSSEEAADRIQNLRTALEDCFAALPREVLEKELDIPPVGVIPVEGWTLLWVGHIGQHAEQIRDILRSRGLLDRE